jgi:hypothetical protein
MNFVIYFLLTFVLSIWQRSFFYKDVGACFGNFFFVLQGSLMSCNIICKCGNDSVRSITEECKNHSHTLKLKNSEVIIIKAAEILAYMSLNSS